MVRYQEIIHPVSIERRLTYGLTVIILAFSCIAVIASLYSARLESVETQDNLLLQLSQLYGMHPQNASFAVGLDDPDGDGRIMIANRQADRFKHLPSGFSDQYVHDQTYRVYIPEVNQPGRIEHSLMFAQSIDVRREYMWSSFFRTFVPLFCLMPLVWFALRFLVQYSFRQLNGLTDHLVQRESNTLDAFETSGLAVEIKPFVVEINTLLQRIKYLLQEKDEFISHAAHELRTPVSVLKMQLHNLKHEPSIDGSLASFRVIENSISRTAHLINQLLAFSRLEQGVISADKAEKLSISGHVTLVMEMLLPLAVEKDIELGVSGEEGTYILAVYEDLTMVLKNLIENAIKYSPENMPVDISWTAKTTQQLQQIMVTNFVPDTALQDIDSFKAPFYRGHNSSQTVGAGLGLAIVDKVCQRNAWQWHFKPYQQTDMLLFTVIIRFEHTKQG